MLGNLENSAVTTGLEKVSFHANPEERQCQGMFKLLHNCTHSHASKVMLKILQARIQKAEKPEIKLPTSVESQKKQENSRKTSTFALLTMPMSFTVGCNKLWKILKEMGIPGHLTCLLRNLSAGQETTVITEYGTTDWFQIGIGLCQACILSPAYLIYMQSI